jgi:cell division protein FtsB
MDWRLRLVIAVLLVAFVALQYRLWVGEGSLAEVAGLKRQLASQQAELDALKARNQSLRDEIDELKKGLAAVEARAREELGMIKEGETYYQIIGQPAAKQDKEGKARR